MCRVHRNQKVRVVLRITVYVALFFKLSCIIKAFLCTNRGKMSELLALTAGRRIRDKSNTVSVRIH